MILAEAFERFVIESPLTVMPRLVLEQSLSSEEVDELFEQQAQQQYHRDLLFSTVVNLMSLVVCGISPSINAVHQLKAKGIGVSVQSVYNKLNLFGLHARGGCFVIRQHGNLPWQALNEPVAKGRNATREVLEQSIQLIFNQSVKMSLRRVVVRLQHLTRDDDLEIAILSNLPVSDASALKIAALYQKRWRVERLFQVLDPCFRGEINTLAYPRAALFGFCMALICYNLLAVLKAAMRTVHGADKIEAGLSII